MIPLYWQLDLFSIAIGMFYCVGIKVGSGFRKKDDFDSSLPWKVKCSWSESFGLAMLPG